MADHDLAAELAGYRDELAECERRGLDERAGAVRKEIKRVEDDIRKVADDLDARAGERLEAGQDELAGRDREEARRYRALLDNDGEGGKEAPAKRGAGRGRKETTADRTPKEHA